MREETFASFALGKREFDKAAENVEPDMLLTFQHGARIIFRVQG